jgi:4a-hydroxytetrahydrobiopterin dehydratase
MRPLLRVPISASRLEVWTMPDPISPRQFHETEGVEDWRVLADGAVAYFATGSFADGVRFVDAIAELPGLRPSQPDIDLRHDGVTVRLITIDGTFYGMTSRDVELARAISGIAHGLGLPAAPAAVQSLLVIPGSLDPEAVMPFWRAALGYEPRADSPDEDLVDPHGRGPGFWFESMDKLRPGGIGAIHLAVWVPPDQAEARIAAVVAAGGRVVRDEFAPAWVTLADAAGNEVDIATTHTGP